MTIKKNSHEYQKDNYIEMLEFYFCFPPLTPSVLLKTSF